MTEPEAPVPPAFCDMCGCDLEKCEVDYRVLIEVVSGDARVDLGSLPEGDVREEIRRLIAEAGKKSEAELMDEVYRRFSFRICPRCQKRYIRDPLPRDF